MIDVTFEFCDTGVRICDACIGWRSAKAMVVLAVAYSVVSTGWNIREMLLSVLAAVGLAAAGNLVRIASIIGLIPLSADFALGLWHDIVGYVVCIVEVIILAKFIERRARKAKED